MGGPRAEVGRSGALKGKSGALKKGIGEETSSGQRAVLDMLAMPNAPAERLAHRCSTAHRGCAMCRPQRAPWKRRVVAHRHWAPQPDTGNKKHQGLDGGAERSGRLSWAGAGQRTCRTGSLSHSPEAGQVEARRAGGRGEKLSHQEEPCKSYYRL